MDSLAQFAEERIHTELKSLKGFALLYVTNKSVRIAGDGRFALAIVEIFLSALFLWWMGIAYFRAI